VSALCDIAVVIAARNPGALLVETLDSVAAQTMLPTEVIVVDDGSTDGSVEAATRGRESVRVCTIEPSGRSIARNTGVQQSAASMLLFLDADDLLTPDALRVLCGGLRAHPSADMVHGLTYEFADTHNPPGPGARHGNQVVDVRLGGCTLLRRSLWDRAGGLDPALSQGEWIEWIDRAGKHARGVVRVDEVVLHRRLHGANGTASTATQSDYLAVARAALQRKRQQGAQQ